MFCFFSSIFCLFEHAAPLKGTPPVPQPHPVARAVPCASPFFLPHWLEVGHGPASSASSHWPNVGQCPAFFQKARQLHKFSPSRASRALADPFISLAEHLKGSGCDWLLLAAGGRHAARVHGPRGGRGPGGGALALASGVLVWIFFSAKEVCFGHASRLPPPPAPSSAPGCTPLGADCKAPFFGRSAKLARARVSPTWYRRSARLCPLGTHNCKETAA